MQATYFGALLRSGTWRGGGPLARDGAAPQTAAMRASQDAVDVPARDDAEMTRFNVRQWMVHLAETRPDYSARTTVSSES
jgi:hypothetical protein